MLMAVSNSLRLTKEKLRLQQTLILNLAWGNNNDANYVDLYARALELSAELRAKNDIQVIAGANNVSADLQDVTPKTGTGTATDIGGRC